MEKEKNNDKADAPKQKQSLADYWRSLGMKDATRPGRGVGRRSCSCRPSSGASPLGLLAVAVVVALNILLAVVAVAQQQTRTTCYDSFPARICETFDGMGNIIAKSRCYRSGNDTRCDTQTFGGQTGPNGNGPDAGWRYSPPNGDRPQR